MKLTDLRETDELMNDGVWMRLDGKGAVIKLRHTYSKAYSHARERAELVLRRRNAYRPDKELSADETSEILVEAASKGLIVDWKGIEGDDGTPLECTEENKRLLLGISSFLVKIVSMAAEEAHFQKENLEQFAGN